MSDVFEDIVVATREVIAALERHRDKSPAEFSGTPEERLLTSLRGIMETFDQSAKETNG